MDILLLLTTRVLQLYDDIPHVLFYQFKLQSDRLTLSKRLNPPFVRFSDGRSA